MDNPIRTAAQNLKGKWHQGYYYSSNNRSNMCGLGHLQTVLFGDNLDFAEESKIDDESLWTVYKATQKILTEIVKEQYPDRINPEGNPFPNFNDHEDTTEDEVIAIMEKAAVRWDERI